ncbi:response regulator [bacterium]|nr:response regulator [bacterium]
MPSVLIIDDDVDMLNSLADVLIQAGYDVASASSGLEALALAETRPLDLVISDVRMAGMDGIECIEKLCEGRAGLKNIVITGYASVEVPGRAMDLDSCDYLCKPFTAEQLLLSVTRALAQQGDEGAVYPPEMREAMSSLMHMEATRRRTLQGFYLGVRSAHLGASTALQIWDHLETVENMHHDLERDLQLRMAALDLQDSYLTVLEYCKSPSIMNGAARKVGGVSRIAFQRLFNNIRTGKINPDQLKIAVSLRRAQKEQPGSEDCGLFRLVWT